MASCQRCHNLLPRTVDQCPVCGLATAVAVPEPEFAPPASPGWAPVPAPTPSLTERLAASSTSPTPVSAPDPVPSAQPGQESAPRSVDEASTPYEASLSFNAQQATFDPASFEEPASFEFPQPIAEPVPEPPPDASTVGQYLPPAAQMSSMQQPNFRQAPSPSSVANGDVPTSRPDLDPTCDDGSIELDDARTVRALSARVGGDVKIGKSQHHQLISGGLLGLGILTLGFGSMLSLAALGAESTVQAVEAPTFDAITDDESIATFVQSHQGSFVEVRTDGCGQGSTHQGVMPDATTVLLPYSAVLTDPVPVVVGSDGKRVLADLISADPGADLAILQTRSPVEGAGLGWSGASQSLPGSAVVMIESRRPGLYTGTSLTVVDRQRNNSGVMAQITADATNLPPGSAVLDAQGRLIGIVDSSGTSITSAEVLQSKTGSAKTNPRTYQAICPEPIADAEQELEIDLEG